MADDLAGIKRPQRWDVPFWSETSEAEASLAAPDVDRLLRLPAFEKMDAARFPAHAPLRDILLNDGRVRRYRAGEIIVRQGDYGNSAFIIIRGAARVVLHPATGNRESGGTSRPGFLPALLRWWRNPSLPEVRQFTARSPGANVETAHVGGPAIFVQDMDLIVKDQRTALLGAGELFGEIAALSRTARVTTVYAGEESELLEIRWQGLREIRQHAPEFKQHLDRKYRENSLNSHLRETRMFRHLDDATLARVASATEFLTFGDFEWYAAFSKTKESSGQERLQKEPVVAREGNYPNGVYLIRSGFARLSETYNHGDRTVSYLGRGQIYGFEEIATNWRDQTDRPFQRTLRALGYVDVLFVPTAVLEALVLPTLPAEEFPRAAARPNGPAWARGADQRGLPPEMLEFLVDRRFINGTAAMIIDMDRCTRCDDCVRACAATHNNNPRFLRHGPIQDGFMIANACLHCQDPVCMIGCPTGAIHRESVHGQVVINDRTCIGCSTCANSCPYDNIQMVTARNPEGRPFLDAATHQPIQKAAKCDLCANQPTGPACAHACPHDALVRADMQDVDRLADFLHHR